MCYDRLITYTYWSKHATICVLLLECRQWLLTSKRHIVALHLRCITIRFLLNCIQTLSRYCKGGQDVPQYLLVIFCCPSHHIAVYHRYLTYILIACITCLLTLYYYEFHNVSIILHFLQRICDTISIELHSDIAALL